MSNPQKKAGTLVVSLDFELMWGMFDKISSNEYDENIKGVYTAVPKLLELFSIYQIRATWATVGLLMCSNEKEMLERSPEIKPNYKILELSAYTYAEKFSTLLNLNPKLYFAPALVKKIIETPGQELASHTFSHYYCLEEQTVSSNYTDGKNSFTADVKAINNIAKNFGITLTSIIFPRNQFSEEALAICNQHGVTAYRGTQNHFLYKARKESQQTNLFIRALRLLDNYINLTGHHTTTINRNNNGLINIRASRFLRPYSKNLFFLESLKLRRIKKSMTEAAVKGQVFHLWWHPHNFGVKQKENFKNLKVILDHYKFLHDKYQMDNKNMKDLSILMNES